MNEPCDDRAGGARPSRAFEDLALAQRLITPEQLEECRKVRDNVVAQGLDCEVEEVLLKKKLVTPAQAAAIHAALGRGNRTAIEGFEILSKLGVGGQGAVYKARQSSMDRLVAVKVLLPKFARDKDGVHRFIREAKAIARLNHPNIVGGIDAGFSNGIYYYVMEYLDGEPLQKRLAREGRLAWRDAVSILRQMGAALHHAHQNGLIHRDVKPANILLLKDGTAKLADLGMARFAGGEDGLTQPGSVVGTPHYIAPEQARGEEDVDIRADLYSLGITCYEMLSGKPPFTGSDPLVVLNKHVNETVRFAIPDVPPELLAIGHRLTERDRARRYAEPAQLLEDLDAFERGQAPVHARSAVRPKTARIPLAAVRRPASRGPLVAGIAAAAALAAILGVALSGGRSQPAPAAPAAERRALPVPVPAAAPAPPREKPADPAEQAALAALTRARQYELANPNDLEEIAAQYAEAAARTAGSAYEGTARKRLEEARSALQKAIDERKAALAAEVKAARDSKKYGAAIDALDRRSREYRSESWKDVISKERSDLAGALEAEAKALREASSAAEARGDREGALAPLRTLASLGVPALHREAEERMGKIEAARATAEAEKARRAESDRVQLETFLGQADAWASARSYDKIEPAAPALATDGPREELRIHLAFYRAGRELLEAARGHALALKGKTASFTLRSGEKVSGRVGAVQEVPVRLLVGERAYDLGEISSRSVVAFYRTSKGAAARPEGVISFALYDGDASLVEETLAKSPVELPARAKKAWEELRRRASEEAARRAQEEREAARLKKEEAAAARSAREFVLYASDLPKSSLGKDFEFWDESVSPGGRMVGIVQDGDTIGPPPDPDASAMFKVQVQAGVPYRCWVHMKVGAAKKKSTANLLWIQFTNAVDKAGKETYTLGTADVLTACAPAREGWVWVGKDLTDPKATEPVLYFRHTGEVTVGIFAGMEGVGFDQFVLSPAQYFAKPPAEAVVPKPRK